jgi:BirA family biotin operon repressor/biotin-[acetyl-CoA-carboxylase] ligase
VTDESAAMARTLVLPGMTDPRVDRLITLLASRPMLILSGARIARELGLSRQAVWRWVEKVRELGVRVRGHPGTGYRVEQAPDVLVPGLLRPRLRGTRFARHIVHFFRTASTNDAALELGWRGAPEGTVVVAEEQTAGRGRAGRSWYSEKATGIYTSVLLRPPLPPARAPLLTLLAGVAVRDAIAGLVGLKGLDLRWPNDVLVGRRKLAGILTEMHATADRIQFVVVGIGINVNQTAFPPPLAGLATSLRIETGRPQARLELLVRLLQHLERDYNRFLSEGPEFVVERFRRLSSYARGRRVRIRSGEEEFTGVTAGLDPAGWLRVRREGGRIETVIAADVEAAD